MLGNDVLADHRVGSLVGLHGQIHVVGSADGCCVSFVQLVLLVLMNVGRLSFGRRVRVGLDLRLMHRLLFVVLA